MKDLFEVAGFAVGAGVPAYLAESRPAATSASAVEALVAAGADVIGIAQTDEFAYSVAGRNSHYGTLPNVAAPGSIPGGSSSGPASAVALGQVSIGLGTDTAGSIRVPASYQGLWGLRTSHGAIDTAGLLPWHRASTLSVGLPEAPRHFSGPRRPRSTAPARSASPLRS